MKILHTSDWHLGQNFMGKSRVEEHKVFLSWLLQTIKEKNVFYLPITINQKNFLKKQFQLEWWTVF